MMKVVVEDKDVLKLISEYLHSRKLYLTANALELETELTSPEQLCDPIVTLRKYAFEGKWKLVRKYMQPFADLYKETFDIKQVLRSLYRQRFCELCFGQKVEDAEVELKDIIEEVWAVHTEQEYNDLLNEIDQYFKIKSEKYRNKAALQQVTRCETYQEILKLIEPILPPGGEKICSQNDRLMSLLIKGLLYDECAGYCCEKAFGKQEILDDNDNIEIYGDMRIAETSLSRIDASLYYWIRGVVHDDLFQREFTDHGIQITQKKFEVNNKSCDSDLHSVRATSDPKMPVHNDDTIALGGTNMLGYHSQVNGNSQAMSGSAALMQIIDRKVDKNVKSAATEKDEIVGDAKVDDPSLMLASKPVGSLEIVQDGSSSNSSTNKDVRDSYALFLEEQKIARADRDELLKTLKQREGEKQALRKALMEDKNEVTETKEKFNSNFFYPQSRSKDLSSSRSSNFSTRFIPFQKTEDSAVIRAVAFHPSNRMLAIGSNSHVLKLCETPKLPVTYSNGDIDMGREPDWMQISMKRSQLHKGSIYALAWNDSGNILATCSNDKLIKLFVYDVITQSLTGPQQVLSHHDGVIRDVTFLGNYGSGSVLAGGGGSDCVVYTYDCGIDTVLHQLSGHSDQVLSLYSWNNGMLASASQDKSVRLWDLRSSRCVGVLGFGDSLDHPKIPTSVCVDTSSKYMAVGRDDHVISLYDLAAHKVVKDFKVHDDEVRSVRFNPCNVDELLSGSYDGTSRITNISHVLQSESDDISAHSYLCKRHNDKVIQCRWNPNGEMFASTSTDQTSLLWVRINT